MKCPAREKKKVLFFHVAQDHEYQLFFLKYDSFFSKWETRLECKHCHARKSYHFITDSQLMYMFGKDCLHPRINQPLGKRSIDEWLS